MNILFIHCDLPGQFLPFMQFMAEQSACQVYAIYDQATADVHDLSDTFILYAYQVENQDNLNAHHYVVDLQRAVCRAQAVVGILCACRTQGIEFDLAIAHTGWGEALYFKDIYPNTPLIGYAEFFFHTYGADVGFDPHYPVNLDFQLQVKTFNAQLLLGLNDCDALISPTQWQKSLFPNAIQTDISVIHEGIDISQVCPNDAVQFTLANGICLTRKHKIITYCARSLEPTRGFPVFIKAVEQICIQYPDCYVLIIGSDEVSYSPPLKNGLSYREQYLQNVNLPVDRVHFLGTVSYQTHLQILQLSSLHIYLTYPFVLSWSLMEAMASECVLICSATAPVLELIQDNHNGLLVNFFDHQAIVAKVNLIFNDPERLRHLGKQARQTIIQSYQRQFSLAHYRNLIQTLIPDFQFNA